jgi:LuxR family maltose regulon positive regulatory protein
VATKLGVPGQTAGLVVRRRLAAAFERQPLPRLIVVSAPPGFGKSTVLVQWLVGWPGGVGWLSLDAGDNDPVVFLGGLWLAVRAATTGTAETPLGEPVDLSRARTGEVIAEIVDMLVGASRPCVVVLDDYHVISNPAVHEAVTLLASRLPEGAHLAIATRADPPLPLARLRAHGALLEVRAEDLRFGSGEAAEFLRLRFGVQLDAPDVDALVTLTEGWAAAIQLAGLSMRDRPDAGAVVRRFGASHRFLLDFVTEEVLAGLAPATLAFLLQTCLLERLCGPLCDAVVLGSGARGHGATGAGGATDAGGQAMLEGLERANLFVVPLDDDRRWYRYHHLFADLLRARLAMHHPEWIPETHARAAAWLEANGFVEEAVRHALASGDGALARGMVRRHWLAVIHAGELDTVDGWLAGLPDAIVRPDPQLNAIRAWLPVLRGTPGDAEQHVRAAEDALAAGPGAVETEDLQAVPVQLACIRSHLARLAGDAATAEASAREALALVPDDLPPIPAAILRGDATILVAYARLLAGDTVGASAALREARPLLVRGGNLVAASRATARLAHLELEAGRPASARELAESAIAEAEAAGQADRPGSAILHVALAQALQRQGDREASRAAALRAIALAHAGGDLVALAEGRAVIARLEPGAEARPGRARAAHRVDSLSDRELEVLRLVALGRSNRQIAAELYLALGTVKAHVHAICAKLGAQNRVEAVARARDDGLL